MSNVVFFLLAVVWFAAGIGIILACRRGLKALREWASIQLEAIRAHRLNKRREKLLESIRRVGGCPDWETVCRIIKY